MYDTYGNLIKEEMNDSFNATYCYLAGLLLKKGSIVNNTLELNNISFKLNSVKNTPFLNNIGRIVSLKYLLAENIWYAAGSNSLNFISKYANKWKEISDDGITSNSAYGYIMQCKYNFNQIEKIIEILTKDKYSRRACIILNDVNEDVIETKDEQCTMFLQFYIRKKLLHLSVFMRSNDFIYGLPNDIVAFVGLQKYIASKLGIGVGSYYHSATSMHVYSKDIHKLYMITHGKCDDVDYDIDFVKLYDKANEIYSKIESNRNFDNIIEICKEEGIVYDV